MRARPPPVLALLACLAFVACTPARMQLPPTLGASPQLEVKGRTALKWKEGFTFGPWEVRGVDRGWRRGTSWSAGGFSSSRSTQKFEFELRGPGGAVLVGQAVSGASARELEGFLPVTVSLDDRATLAVAFAAPGGAPERAVKLLLRGPLDGPLTGTLRVPGAAPVQVEGTQRLAGSSLGVGATSGYVFLRDGRALGAVEVLNAGRVLLAPGLTEDDREALAAAAAALLLYRPLEP